MRGRRIAGAASTVAIGAWIGHWAGRRYERAVLDSCAYGAGSGSQSFCLAGATERPMTVLTWTVTGVALGAAVTTVALVARREVS